MRACAVLSYALALIATLLLQLPDPAQAQTWQQGIENDTAGRFGHWPTWYDGPGNPPNLIQCYEDDLIGRVDGMSIKRTVNGQFCAVEFGALPAPSYANNVVTSIDVLNCNWIYKQWRVWRNAPQYDLAVSSISPGIMINTQENGFYVTAFNPENPVPAPTNLFTKCVFMRTAWPLCARSVGRSTRGRRIHPTTGVETGSCSSAAGQRASGSRSRCSLSSPNTRVCAQQ